MKRTLPGTTLTCPPELTDDAFSVLSPIFAVSAGGLLLSQVVEMTGLSPSTIQNWVKRGWVSNPINKKYGEIQVARILIINLLRSAMQLEKIARLLSYVNGRVDDRTDDSLSDPRLYSLLCAAIFQWQDGGDISREALVALIDRHMQGYERTVADAEERLLNALELMLLSVQASELMRQADMLYEEISR